MADVSQDYQNFACTSKRDSSALSDGFAQAALHYRQLGAEFFLESLDCKYFDGYSFKRSQVLLIEKLPFDAQEKEILNLFSQGQLKDIRIQAVKVTRDEGTTVGKGFAHILFQSKTDASRALSEAGQLSLRDRVLRLARLKLPKSKSLSKVNQDSQEWARRKVKRKNAKRICQAMKAKSRSRSLSNARNGKVDTLAQTNQGKGKCKDAVMKSMWQKTLQQASSGRPSNNDKEETGTGNNRSRNLQPATQKKLKRHRVNPRELKRRKKARTIELAKERDRALLNKLPR